MRQGSLFDIAAPEHPDATIGLAGLLSNIRAEMNSSAQAYEPGRKHLADAVSAVAERERVGLTAGGGKKVSPEVVDKWLQPQERGHSPSLEAIVCFCLATGDARPMRPLLKLLGLTAVAEADLEYLEYGKTCAALRELRERKTKLEARL